MNIREMKIEDYSEVFGLWTSSKGVGLRNLDDSEEGIKKFLQRNEKTNFVVVDDDKITGVILCGHDGRRAYIYHMFVDESYRGHGLGKKLVDNVMEVLKNEGINKVALVVFTDNEIGNPFWKAIGFEKRDDLYYYNKSLNTANY